MSEWSFSEAAVEFYRTAMRLDPQARLAVDRLFLRLDLDPVAESHPIDAADFTETLPPGYQLRVAYEPIANSGQLVAALIAISADQTRFSLLSFAQLEEEDF